jgi:hypothetical protein
MSKVGASLGARLRLGVLIVAVGAAMLLGPPALAKPRPQPQPSPTGYDVSYPQCGKALPAAAFAIVGVNGGIVFSANPCLGTGNGPSELAWAQEAANRAPAFYANTGDPGPAYSSRWPTGQTSPQLCDAAALNSPSCSYDYGWNAAADSFRDAVVAEQQVNGSSDTVAAAAAAQAVWWLDVETGNSWQTLESAYGQTAASRANDMAALDGAVAYLQSVGVSTVGFYSTAYQWTQITGGTGTHFAANPSWIAGFTSASAAQSGCKSVGFTGGIVQLTQYHANGLDADYACT